MSAPSQHGEVAINGEVVGTLLGDAVFDPTPAPTGCGIDLLLGGDPHVSRYNPVFIVHPLQWSLIKAVCIERPGELAVSLYGCEVYRSRHLAPPGGARRKRARVRRVA